jgi:hypothetical protein
MFSRHEFVLVAMRAHTSRKGPPALFSDQLTAPIYTAKRRGMPQRELPEILVHSFGLCLDVLDNDTRQL